MMTTPGDIDTSLLDTSCRVLTISSSLVQATTLIHRVQNLRNVQPSITSPDPHSSNPPTLGSLGSTIKIPWTISNRYYSADIHFAAHTVHGLSSHHFQNIPAVIFAWTQGESYKDDIKRISQDIGDSEPEVCLAVKLPRNVTSDSTEAEDIVEVEDDGDIDTFLSAHGFEYIDSTGEYSLSRDESEERSMHSDGIPGLPRVLDALSTIMWPSMQRKGTGNRTSRLLDWSQDSIDSSYSAIEEVQELVQWLDEDHPWQHDPWRTAANSGTISMSPTEIKDNTIGLTQTEKESSFGFDDDFTVYVSAPAVESVEGSGHSTPEISVRSLSTPSHANDLYRSLGSVSDSGDSDDGNQADKDPDLPSREEILTTSSRIFGTPHGLSPHSRAGVTQPTSIPSGPQNVTVSLNIKDLETVSPLDTGVESENDGPYDMEPFDLSRVFSALQEMKAEIATMEDEGERRKAAAKVALGLVYGLEADAGL